ncbi:MAG: DsbA family protein [Nitrosarchaeum sp.]
MEDNIETSDANITIKKSTFNKLIIGTIAVAIISAFFGGYVVGVNSAEPEQIYIQNSEDVLGTTDNKQVTKPQTIMVSLDDDPMIGNPNAPITMIEFSDFQCPFCKRFHDETLPLIKTNYIDTGKIKFVYRDFPINNIHKNALPAALAAECADDQKKFWPYYDKIFQNQAQWKDLEFNEIVTLFKQYASELNLNEDEFGACLDSGKYLDEVNNDYQDGQNYGIDGTPGFFIGNDKIGYTKVSGAKPYQSFQLILDEMLAK